MNLVSRYGEAYVIARSTARLGRIVWRVCLPGGLVLVALGLVLSILDQVNLLDTHSLGPLALVVGASCFVGFVAGVIMAVQGQIMMAVLDTAVNTSPLATNQEKTVALG
jgi:hypothetical protein